MHDSLCEEIQIHSAQVLYSSGRNLPGHGPGRPVFSIGKFSRHILKTYSVAAFHWEIFLRNFYVSVATRNS